MSKTLIYSLILILIISSFIFFISGCGGEGTSSITPSINQSEDTGDAEINVDWPDEGKEVTAQVIHPDVVQIVISITGKWIKGTREEIIYKGTTTKKISALPSGENQFEFTGMATGGNVLSHRITNVTIKKKETVKVSVHLGVSILDTGFFPQTIPVSKGDTLFWKNNDSVVHNVVADNSSFNSGDIAPGAEWSRKFDSEGTFTYKCTKTGKAGTVTTGIAPTPTVVPGMVAIAGGTFQMGSNTHSIEQPIHSVTVSSFSMGKYEVTNTEFCAFLNSQGNQTEGGTTWMDIKDDIFCGITGGPGAGTFTVKSGYENHPAVYVSWYGTVAYCNWLSEQNSLTPCYGPKDNRGNDPSVWRTKNGYRLPTEAEWEYACRAGSTTDYYWGNTVDGSYCWYFVNSDTGNGNNHQIAGQKLPNTFGLYDMSGNVDEWCNDWGGDYGAGAITDPAGPNSGIYRVKRGGSWADEYGYYCRSAARVYGTHYVPLGGNPDEKGASIGFRIVKGDGGNPGNGYSFLRKWGSHYALYSTRRLATDSSGNIYVSDLDNHRIQKYNSSGGFITEWGTFGTGDGQFDMLKGITLDNFDNVYVTEGNNARIQKFTSSGVFITKWGSGGHGDGQFYGLTGIAIDSSGNVYVSDHSNNRIQKFTSSGVFITKWGSGGNGDGQFHGPEGITVDTSDNVYVADSSNDRIQKFTSSGVFITKWGGIYGSNDGEFLESIGIAIDMSDNVYVTDAYSNRIQKFTSSGVFITKWGSYGKNDGQFDGRDGITVDFSGNVYVVDNFNERIQKFTSSGSFITKWSIYGNSNTDGKFDDPYFLTQDSSGNVYVSDCFNNRIQKFTSSGVFITKWGSHGMDDGQFHDPTGIAIDSFGTVYVSDYSNGRIQKFTSSGVFITKWGSGLPYGIAVDSSGNIYVTDIDNDRIQKFTSSGVFITNWGSYGSNDGQFFDPTGITVDTSGNVYVSDSGNYRIQKFTSSGVFITKWGSSGTNDGQFKYPKGITLDTADNVYVADYFGNVYISETSEHIQKFTSSGVFITKWGSNGNSDGQFYSPTGIIVDSSGNVYVVDSNNDRIQVFAPSP